MSLSAEEGAKKLYALLYGKTKKVGRPPGSVKSKGPVRDHKLIGCASIEEIRARVALRKQQGGTNQ